MPGFTSTTLDVKAGLNFAFQNIGVEDDEEKMPVLLEMTLRVPINSSF